MHHAQRQGAAAGGVQTNLIHCFKHVPTFSGIYSAAFCRNITLRGRRHGAPAASSNGLISIKWHAPPRPELAGQATIGRAPCQSTSSSKHHLRQHPPPSAQGASKYRGGVRGIVSGARHRSRSSDQRRRRGTAMPRVCRQCCWLAYAHPARLRKCPGPGAAPTSRSYTLTLSGLAITVRAIISVSGHEAMASEYASQRCRLSMRRMVMPLPLM